MNIEESIKEYRNITLSILDAVKTEDYEKLEEMLGERQIILDNTKDLSYTKEEYIKVYYQYEIDKLDKVLMSEMEEKKNAIKDKIQENRKRKIATKSYNNLSGRAVFLSKEI